MSLAARYLTYKGPASVESLPMGRDRVTRKWVVPQVEYARAQQFKKYLFQDYGTLDGDLTGIDPKFILEPVPEDLFTDARLVDQRFGDSPDGQEARGEVVLIKVYETLTGEWVDEDYLKPGSTDNGLAIVSRSQVAIGGTAALYSNEDVGEAFIHVIGRSIVAEGTAGAKKLYLAGFEDQSSERMGRFSSKWAEAGLLKKFVSGGPDELLQISWTFLVAETPATVVGRVTDRDVSNWEGLRTIVISTINAPDGSDILGPDDADKAVMYYQDFRPWTRPGIAGIRTRLRLPPDYSATAVSLFQRSPVQMKLRVHIGAIMSKSPDMTKDTMTAFTGVDRYWNPEKWATLEALPATAGELEGDEPPPPPLAIVDDISRTLRGFRKITSDDTDWNGGTLDENNPTNIKDTGDCKGGNVFLSWVYGQWFGKFLSISTTDGTVLGTASIVAGPERPEGKTWVIDMDNDEAFTDEDGVKYYRKFFVWAYVPEFQDGEDVFTDDPNTPIPDVYDDVRGT
jgi:hypothetical protein